uniref:Phytocyanin domain-containing protein n=1 Tax=Brassica campestris TaxID=3711 RepID=A0A3P6D0L8_BRACM|nr:unnamed protein product [Brassica rapa]
MTTNGLSKMAAATVLLVIMSIVPAAVAVTYSVGDFNGWTSGVDYTVWLTGDILEFKYGPAHSVDAMDVIAPYPPRSTPTETPKSNSRLSEGTKYIFHLSNTWPLHQWHEASRYGHRLRLLSSHPSATVTCCSSSESHPYAAVSCYTSSHPSPAVS